MGIGASLLSLFHFLYLRFLNITLSVHCPQLFLSLSSLFQSFFSYKVRFSFETTILNLQQKICGL
ncbi:hypothetical protein AMTRI_Chr01g110790 [Amborella trichopoda]